MAGVCTALVLVCIAIYGQTLSHGFLNCDDPVAVTDNRPVQAGLSWANVVWAFTNNRATYMIPVMWTSHMIDCELYGLRPWGHHLTSLILHVVISILIFLVFARMTRRLWPSALMAALFAVHPLHVESVAWIAERKGVLSMLFWMATLGGYAWYRQRPNPVRYAAVMFLFALGLMSKPMVVPLPFVLLLLDYWPLDQMDRTGPPAAMARRAVWLVVEKIPLFLLTALFCVITFLKTEPGARGFSKAVPFMGRCANATVAYALYLVKTAWPSGLTVYYPLPNTYPVWQVAGSALVLAAITLFCLRHALRRPYLIVGWLWYLGTLVPTIGLVQAGDWSHADRYTYTPHIGIFIMVVWGMADLAAARHLPGRVVGAVSGVVLVLFTACSCVQAGYWRDSETLFRHALAVGEESSFALNSLGLVALDQRHYDEAGPLLTRALDLDPKNASALNNMGVLALNQRRFDEARTYLERAVDRNPGNPKIVNNVGLLALEQGRYDDARTWLTRSVTMDPLEVDTLNNLGKLALDEGRYDEARPYLTKALDLDPKSVDALNNMGLLSLDQGRHDEAMSWLTKALDLDPRNVNALNNMGTLALRRERYDEARTCLTKALALDPEYANALYNMGVLALDQKRYDEAIPWLTKVLDLNPKNAVALNNLGWCLMNQGQYEKARKQFQKALEIDPQYARAMFNLGDALAKLGHREEAAGCVKRAAEMEKSNQSRAAGKQ